MLRKLILASLIGLCGALPAQAALRGNPECQKLVAEGHALAARMQYKEALEKFEQARKLSPEASEPLSSIASVLHTIASNRDDEPARTLRGQARALAQQALALEPIDPIASEVLRMLDDPTEVDAYRPSEAVVALMGEGEALFHAGNYEAAREKYRAIQRAEPKYVFGWLMEGDTYFMEKNWAAAEMLFHKATEVDPRSAQAWRFLADAQAHLGDRAAVEESALRAVAVQPSQKPSWDRLAMLGQDAGKPLARLQLQRRASAVRDPKTGKFNVNVSDVFKDAKADSNADFAVWLLYAISVARLQSDAEQSGRSVSAFAVELEGWKTALKVADDLEQKGVPPVADPALKSLRKVHADGQLDAAILLLMYREAYRSEFEAWKQAHPDGVKQFVTTYRMMP
jgi:tetratricopeptide (TPR) repeat protein